MQRVRATSDLSARKPGWVLIALRIGAWTAVAVRAIDWLIATVAIAHCAILIVAVYLRQWLIDRQLQVVGANAVPVRIGIAEHTPKQHFIRAGSNAGHHIRWLKRRLLDLREEILRVAIEHQPSDGDRGIVTMRPDFGEIKGIEAVSLSILERHNLHFQTPNR